MAMRSTNPVEEKTTRKARLRRIGRFLARPVSALGRARTRVQRRRRQTVAQSCAASATDVPGVSHVSIDDSRVPLIDGVAGFGLLVPSGEWHVGCRRVSAYLTPAPVPTVPDIKASARHRTCGCRIEDFTNAVSSFLSTTVGIALDAHNQGFPAQVTPFKESARYPAGDRQQSLTAIGSKQWGSWWDGRGLLRVKIYDFALYTNPRQLTALAPTLARRCDSDGAPNPLSPASTLPGLAPLSPPSNVSSFSQASPQRLQRLERMHPSANANSSYLSNSASTASPDAELTTSDAELTTISKSLRKRLRPRLPLRRRNRSSKGGTGAITDSVRAAATQVEMSLCVRPARDLPLMMLRGEYSRILRKRLKIVGGNTEDAALATLLSYFNPEKLPQGATRRGCIRKGTNMVFSRSKSGMLTTTADGALITTVQSSKLCEAVFDLYLGSNPVCKKARDTAKEKYEGIVSSSKPLALKGLSIKGLSVAV